MGDRARSHVVLAALVRLARQLRRMLPPQAVDGAAQSLLQVSEQARAVARSPAPRIGLSLCQALARSVSLGLARLSRLPLSRARRRSPSPP